MENKSAKELIDYYKKLTEYIKNLESKKLEIETSLEQDKEKIKDIPPEEVGVFDVEDNEKEGVENA